LNNTPLLDDIMVLDKAGGELIKSVASRWHAGLLSWPATGFLPKKRERWCMIFWQRPIHTAVPMDARLSSKNQPGGT